MRRTVVLAAAAIVAVAVLVFLALRPSASGPSVVDPDVTIECVGSTGMDAEACVALGDRILAAGPPSFTFELNDLTLLTVDRGLLGFAPTCRVEYIIGRFAEPAWVTEEVDCGGS